VVDELAQSFADQPVVFIEYDVDNVSLFGARQSRWWAAHGSGTVLLPLTMVDSGNLIDNGPPDRSTYENMVNSAMARPAQAEIQASGSRVGERLRFEVQVKNLSGVALSSSNGATVWAIVYEEAHIANTNRYARAAISTGISNLPHGQVAHLVLETPELNGVDWDKLHPLILAEYRPGGTSGPWDMLQAALVQPDFDIKPDSVTFLVDPVGGESPSSTLTIVASSTISWTAVSDSEWLTITPQSGTTDIQPIVSVITEHLAAGWQLGTLTFTIPSNAALTDRVAARAFFGPVERVFVPLVTRRE